MNRSTLGREYFAALYSRTDDPWNFESSEYEHAKYATTLTSLPRDRFVRALEVGCSIGVLTAALAPRCDELLAVDLDQRALSLARSRCASLRHVRFERMQLPQEIPQGRFDLILLSEVGYYWSHDDLSLAAERLIHLLHRDGTLVLVHWTGVVPEHPLTGDQVHDHFLALAEGPRARLRHRQGRAEEHYRWDVLAKA